MVPHNYGALSGLSCEYIGIAYYTCSYKAISVCVTVSIHYSHITVYNHIHYSHLLDKRDMWFLKQINTDSRNAAVDPRWGRVIPQTLPTDFSIDNTAILGECSTLWGERKRVHRYYCTKMVACSFS